METIEKPKRKRDTRTFAQKELARRIANREIKPGELGRNLVDIGYSETTARAEAKEIVESAGVQAELADYGFTEDNAKKVVSSILHSAEAKNRDKLDAADKIFKVHGTYAPEKKLNINARVDIQSPKVKEIRAEYEARLRATLMEDAEDSVDKP